MSGHSKWATIKRQKGVADQQRGLTFTKLSNAITIAVIQGGRITDIDSNFRLRLAVEKAQDANMPKENIKRAIDRALGKQGGVLEEVVYEGFAPFGVAVMVEAATDNRERTTSEIKNLFNKEGGNFGQRGSVAYQFRPLGKIIAKKENKTFDQIFEIALNVGAEDIEEKETECVIYTQGAELSTVRSRLMEKRITITSIELARKPVVTVPIENKDQFDRVVGFLQKLEDLDDVQKVYSNLA